jgi:GT2 family glycosyltransferase
MITSSENLGFAGGHNELFKKSNSEYVLLLSSDMYLKNDCVEKMVHILDTHQEINVATARLMKWNFEHYPDPTSFTEYIDSLGLKIFRSRRVVEWMAGEVWNTVKVQFKDAHYIEVFGVSGALPLFRRTCFTSQVSSSGEIFDPSFSSYKEDVDLAFRLRSAGHRAVVVLDAVGYHDRKAAMPKEKGDRGALQNKQQQSEIIKYNSYKNHLMILYKNEYWQNLILDFLWIFWYEVKKFSYFLLFDRAVLKGLQMVWNKRKDLKELRKRNKELRKVSWKELRHWWT